MWYDEAVFDSPADFKVRRSPAFSKKHCPYFPPISPLSNQKDTMKIFVGNLSFAATEDSVRSLFETHGTVDRVNIMTDRDTGRSRGFAFVEMNDADAGKAIAALNGREVAGRALTVNEARPKLDRGFGGGFRNQSGRRSQARW